MDRPVSVAVCAAGPDAREHTGDKRGRLEGHQRAAAARHRRQARALSREQRGQHRARAVRPDFRGRHGQVCLHVTLLHICTILY